MRRTSGTNSQVNPMDWSGHICVPRSKNDDVNAVLASDQWDQLLDVLAVPKPLWDSLEKYGLWTALNLRCGLLIDQYEEEWLEPSALEAARQVVETHRNALLVIDTALSGFLDNLLAMIATAKEREVAVIFAF
jgi:hypothetical protein